jgi:hypothetical protein
MDPIGTSGVDVPDRQSSPQALKRDLFAGGFAARVELVPFPMVQRSS